ncbi:hypothetical protein AAHB37_08280 [Glutamicibacter halophytocola]|uniref:hypothetical protein n=1 Tax=Glutamicibacter halophytocola TaxID=1933880 RepID=UPI00321993F7
MGLGSATAWPVPPPVRVASSDMAIEQSAIAPPGLLLVTAPESQEPLLGVVGTLSSVPKSAAIGQANSRSAHGAIHPQAIANQPGRGSAGAAGV